MTNAAQRRLPLLVTSAVLALLPGLAGAQDSGPIVSTTPATVGQETRLNPTGRAIPMGGPLIDNGFVVGDLDYVLRPDDSIWLDAPGLLQLLSSVLNGSQHAALASKIDGQQEISLQQLAEAGIHITYDPATFQLSMAIAPSLRPRRTISVAGLPPQAMGEVASPADFSAYVTAFGNIDYVHTGFDSGLASPNILLESAVRYQGFVFENEATWQDRLRRQATRLVFDDRHRMARYAAGDLRVASRGFSGAAPIAGLSMERVYSEIDPQRNVQPRGQRSFTLERAATVETYINGALVQQTRLNPGTYDLRDFPFAQGANDVQLVVRDDSGIASTINFTINFDRNLLASGLTEFGLYAGVASPYGPTGRRYTNDPLASGFLRRGLTDELTAGGNFQLGERGGVAGAEVVWASPVGTVGFDLAGSQVSGVGAGYAFNLGVERNFGSSDRNSSLVATFQMISRDFSAADATRAYNPFAYEIGLTYSLGLARDHYISLDGFYSRGRDDTLDRFSLRAVHGWRATSQLFVTTEATYQDRGYEKDFGVRAAVTMRFGRRSSATAEIDTRREGGRLSYQTSSGRGVGSYNGQASLDYFNNLSSFNGSMSVLLNRAEVGAAHLTSYSRDDDRIMDQRTSLRFGTSVALADGQVALSRPIYDSFALLKPHGSLGEAPVYVSPTGNEHLGKSGTFGPGVAAELSSYTPQLITYDVPDAPLGYDLGSGVVEVLPPYRAGYIVEVGSSYSVTYIGQLLNKAGEPLALASGRAFEIAEPDRPPLQMFTNSLGRFAVSGLRPGRWRIEIPTADRVRTYFLDIPSDAPSLLRGGELQPESTK